MWRPQRWTFPRRVVDSSAELGESRRPLQLFERGVWDPAHEYWGEPGDMIEVSIVEVIAGGPRPQYEFEQLLPGGEDPDAADPILEAVDLSARGQPDRARALLDGLIEWDERCLDAYAHLGALSFNENDPVAAQAHYAAGVHIGERSLPPDFGGVLPWGQIDNRPFLRCLHGLTLSTWRLEEHEQAETLCSALLWLNPADNQGARELLGAIIARELWSPSR
jgi:hypothetical protein